MLHIAKKVIIIQTSYDRIAFYAIRQMQHTNAIEWAYEMFHIYANKNFNVTQNYSTKFQRKFTSIFSMILDHIFYDHYDGVPKSFNVVSR